MKCSVWFNDQKLAVLSPAQVEPHLEFPGLSLSRGVKSCEEVEALIDRASESGGVLEAEVRVVLDQGPHRVWSPYGTEPLCVNGIWERVSVSVGGVTFGDASRNLAPRRALAYLPPQACGILPE